MERKFDRNILIVCEGEGTEPNYFHQIRDKIIEKKIPISITIKPSPTEDSEAEVSFQPRKKSMVRQLKNPLTEIISDDDLRDYKEQPTRYVRAAQINLTNKEYAEVWAVFDKDQHPGHERAFKMAQEEINGKKVNIAFSSIAFEHWILLHFEQNITGFSKSMCRIGDDQIFCGENSHTQDCNGVDCVCGRIVHRGYLNYEGKRKKFQFSAFNNLVVTAIENSVLLSNSYLGNSTPIYQLNPYTSIYRLVFKLNNLPLDYIWKDFTEPFQFKHFEAKYAAQNPVITINLTRISDGSEIINDEDFVLVDAAGKQQICGTRKNLIQSINSDTITITVTRNSNFKPIFIARRINEIEYHISEIPF